MALKSRSTLRRLRAIKRGWTQPDKKMQERVKKAIMRKTSAGQVAIRPSQILSAFGQAQNIPEIKKIFGKSIMQSARRKRESKIARTLNRMATKYALDAAGVTNKKVRDIIHSATKKLVDASLEGSAEAAAEADVEFEKALIKNLGAIRLALFLRQFKKNVRELRKNWGI